MLFAGILCITGYSMLFTGTLCIISHSMLFTGTLSIYTVYRDTVYYRSLYAVYRDTVYYKSYYSIYRDIMCGMLHCEHNNEKLMFWKEALSYTMPEGRVMVNGVWRDCFGAILDVGLDYEDPGMIPDGAKCADNKVPAC